MDIWATWNRPDGRKVNIEMVGLDRSLTGGPQRMVAGDLAAVMRDRSVVVDAMYLDLLGVIIGALVISQTLFSLLQDHRPHYATMLALGFEVGLLGKVVFFQALGLWVIGVLLGGAAFWGAAVVAEASPVPLRMPPGVLALLLGCQALATVAAGFWVLRKLRRIDPAAVFQS